MIIIYDHHETTSQKMFFFGFYNDYILSPDNTFDTFFNDFLHTTLKWHLRHTLKLRPFKNYTLAAKDP